MQRQRHKDAEGKAVGLNIAGVNKSCLLVKTITDSFKTEIDSFIVFLI